MARAVNEEPLVLFDRFEAIYLCTGFVDMRKAIDGLSAIVALELNEDIYSRSLFLFCNRRKKILKALYWDKTGFAQWIKRLEEDRFYWPKAQSQGSIIISSQWLHWLLSGVDVWKLKPHKKLKYSKSF